MHSQSLNGGARSPVRTALRYHIRVSWEKYREFATETAFAIRLSPVFMRVLTDFVQFR
jgi:hypothetical protein